MRLAPLLDFSVWGSDWGEYYHLTQQLVGTGQHASESLGWGKAYVDFPGLFDLTGAAALTLGLSVPSTMNLVIPCVSAISCLAVACIVLRLVRDPWAALFSALLLAFIFPEVYQNSHPVPGSVGSLLVLSIMLVFIIGDAWGRDRDVDVSRPASLHVLFLVLAGALMVTHHLSLYFVLIAVGTAYLVRSMMVRGTEVHRSHWGAFSLVTLLGAATIYWLMLAPVFREKVMVDLLGIPGWMVITLVWVALVPFLLVCRALSRRGSVPYDPPFWGPSLLRVFVVLFVVAAVAVILLVATFGYPGTSIQPGPVMVWYVLPTALAFTVVVGSSDGVIRRHGGHVVIAWLGALVLSFAFAWVTRSQVLISYRHMPPIVEVGVVLLGVGIVHIRRMAMPEGRRWSMTTGMAVAVLLALLVLTAYPPKEVMGGFQEGTTQGEMAAAIWLQGGVPAPGTDPSDLRAGTVATDHRLSSVSFGVGGQMATWDTAGPVLFGSGDEATMDALDALETPEGTRPVSVVFLSEDFRTGAALHQWDTAEPVEGEAWDKFFSPPYVPLYAGEDAWVMGIVRPL